MKLGLFLETVPSVQSIEVYNEFRNCVIKDCLKNAILILKKVVFTFFSVAEGIICVYLDVDEEV